MKLQMMSSVKVNMQYCIDDSSFCLFGIFFLNRLFQDTNSGMLETLTRGGLWPFWKSDHIGLKAAVPLEGGVQPCPRSKKSHLIRLNKAGSR